MALKKMGIVDNYENIRNFSIAIVGKFYLINKT
jgi:hypothetical protein